MPALELTFEDTRHVSVAVVAAQWHTKVMDGLLDGALTALHRLGIEPVVVRVPGAFERPVTAGRLAGRGYDAIVALGAVIRGDTPHFEHVARECASGLQRVALDTGVPVGFGVLTTDDFAQAQARAGGAEGNKGYDAAQSVIQMALLRRDVSR
jgi:6,7-dimethyl-8-ribityllumazine synthase